MSSLQFHVTNHEVFDDAHRSANVQRMQRMRRMRRMRRRRRGTSGRGGTGALRLQLLQRQLLRVSGKKSI